MKNDISIKKLAQDIHYAVLNIQPDRLSEFLCLLETDEEKKQLIDYMEDNKTFQYISILGSALRDYGQWSEPLKIQKRRSDNKRQIAILEHYLDVNISIGIPTSILDAFFKADEEQSNDEVLEVPKTDLLTQGTREIDIDLYLAVSRLQYHHVKELLSKGADPEVCVNGKSAADVAHVEVECNIDIVYSILTGESECKDLSDESMLMRYAVYDRMLYLFKTFRTKTFTKKEGYLWLKDICEVYSHYTQRIPDKCDQIDFRFDFPDSGWIDMSFYKNGKSVNYVSFSDVYEPFDALKGWIEQIAKSKEVGHQYASSVCIDCEGTHVILTCQPMWGHTVGINNSTVSHFECCVLTIYDEAEDRMILEAYCDIDDFVRSFYSALIGFCKETSTQVEFITGWLWDAYNKEMDNYEYNSPEQNAILYNRMKSLLI